jgi:hypothetical protein
MHNTASRARGFGFTPKLISIPFDIIQSIGDHDVVARQGSFDGAEFCTAELFLEGGGGVDLISEGEITLSARRVWV